MVIPSLSDTDTLSILFLLACIATMAGLLLDWFRVAFACVRWDDCVLASIYHSVHTWPIHLLTAPCNDLAASQPVVTVLANSSRSASQRFAIVIAYVCECVSV